MAWSGVDDAKEKYPVLAKIIDNIFVLAAGRVILPIVGTVATAALGYGMTKITILDDLSHDVPALAQAIGKINDKLDEQGRQVTKHTVQLENLDDVIKNQNKSNSLVIDLNARFGNLDKVLDDLRSKFDAAHDSQIRMEGSMSTMSQRLDTMTKRLDEDERSKVQ